MFYLEKTLERLGFEVTFNPPCKMGLTGLNAVFQGSLHNVCVTACYFIVNVLDLPFASPIATIAKYVYKSMLNKR